MKSPIACREFRNPDRVCSGERSQRTSTHRRVHHSELPCRSTASLWGACSFCTGRAAAPSYGGTPSRTLRTGPAPGRPSMADEYRLTVRNLPHLQNCGLRWMSREDGRKSRLQYRFRWRCSARCGINLRPPTGFTGFTCWWSGGRSRLFEGARQNRDASTLPRLRAPPRRRGRDEVVPQVRISDRSWGPELLTAPERHGAVACLRRCSTQPRRRSARRRARRPAVLVVPPSVHDPLPTLIEHGFVVLVHGSRDDAENVQHKIAEVLEPPGLRLSRARTRIAPMSEQFAVATDEVTVRRRSARGARASRRHPKSQLINTGALLVSRHAHRTPQGPPPPVQGFPKYALDSRGRSPSRSAATLTGPDRTAKARLRTGPATRSAR